MQRLNANRPCAKQAPDTTTRVPPKARRCRKQSCLRADFRFLLLREVILGNGVEKNAEESDGRADSVVRRNGVLEDEDRGDDDDDALNSVGHSMCDGVNTVEGLEGDLLVEVEEESGNEDVGDEFGGSDNGCCAGGGGLPRLDQFPGVVDDEGYGCEDDGAHDGEDAKQVCDAHVLALRLVHAELGEDVASGEGKVTAHRGEEAEPGEGDLGDRGHDDAADDREERRVDGEGEDRVEEDGRGHDVDKRLERLDDVGEADGDGAEGDDGGDVAGDVGEADGEERLEGLGGDFGLLADAARPERQDVRGADDELDPRDEPGDGEPGEDALVRDVVDNVEGVPEGDVEADFERRRHFLWRLCGGGCRLFACGRGTEVRRRRARGEGQGCAAPPRTAGRKCRGAESGVRGSEAGAADGRGGRDEGHGCGEGGSDRCGMGLEMGGDLGRGQRCTGFHQSGRGCARWMSSVFILGGRIGTIFVWPLSLFWFMNV